MNPIRIIFFDIDGTLVDPATGSIPHSTREALKQLHDRGILLCIATGRPCASLPDLRGLPFDAFCTFNGSFCYTNTETIFSNPLPREAVETVLENTKKMGRPVSVAVRNRMAANGWDPDLSDYYRLAGLELTVAEDFTEACREDIYQIMVGCRPSEHEAIIRGAENVKLAVSWERAADVIPLSGGKGVAIGKILAHFHLTPSQAMAFGDSYNDMDMLQAVGTGVAMGNAAPKLKEIADAVCGSVSEDGIYRICADLGLI